MRKIITTCAGLLLVLSSAVFAEQDQGGSALEHANAAASASSGAEVAAHAKVASAASMATALVRKGVSKNHMEAASEHLDQAVTEGQKGHADVAKKHVHAALAEMQIANKK